MSKTGNQLLNVSDALSAGNGRTKTRDVPEVQVHTVEW